MKVLPAPAIAFSSDEGRQLFRESLASGHAEAFFPLIEQFRTQDDPSFCGPATLVMVLNSLGVDPGRLWKGPWRWYNETGLECCKSSEDIARGGIEFHEFLCLARCEGLHVDSQFAQESSLEAFEAICEQVCSQKSGRVLTLAYTRKAVNQEGAGHYSPVGAYHRERKLALVLDTARFKYPPHWLPVQALFEAMSVVCESTSKSRGFAVLEISDIMIADCLSVKATWRAWSATMSWRTDKLPELVQAHLDSQAALKADMPEGTPEANWEASYQDELWAFARGLPPAAASLVKVQRPAADADEEPGVLKELHTTRMFLTLKALSAAKPKATMPASLEAICFIMIMLGRQGLLEEACPRSVGLWGKELVEADQREPKALESALDELVKQTTSISEQVAPVQSCCSFRFAECEDHAVACPSPGANPFGHL